MSHKVILYPPRSGPGPGASFMNIQLLHILNKFILKFYLLKMLHLKLKLLIRTAPEEEKNFGLEGEYFWF